MSSIVRDLSQPPARHRFSVLTTALLLGFCTAASADDVLFENIRTFDGKRAPVLSAPSNVLVRGNVIAQISTDLIEAEGAQRIAGNGRTLMPGLIDAHWHAAMLVAPTPAEAHGDVGFNNLVAGDEATATLMHGFTGRDSGKQAAWNSNVGGAAGAGRRAASQGQRTSIYHP